jgi:hypothetical protein
MPASSLLKAAGELLRQEPTFAKIFGITEGSNPLGYEVQYIRD